MTTRTNTPTIPCQSPQADDETDAEYLIRMVQCAVDCKAGDLQSVDAYAIEQVDMAWTNKGHKRVQTREWTTLLAFTEDDEMLWSDCMLGEMCD